MFKNFLFLNIIFLPVLKGDCSKGSGSQRSLTHATHLSLLDITRAQTQAVKTEEKYLPLKANTSLSDVRGMFQGS